MIPLLLVFSTYYSGLYSYLLSGEILFGPLEFKCCIYIYRQHLCSVEPELLEKLSSNQCLDCKTFIINITAYVIVLRISFFYASVKMPTEKKNVCIHGIQMKTW